MSEDTKPPYAPGDAGESNDPIARLIRTAGPRPAVPTEVEWRVRNTVQAHWSGTVQRARRRRVVVAVASLAAVLVIAVGTGLWMRREIGTSRSPAATVALVQGRVLSGSGFLTGPGVVLAAGAELMTGPDGRAALQLEDGSSLRLDFGTGLRLVSDSAFELHHGAIYIDTGGRHPGATPIEVRTRLGKVRDVGTQFEVRLEEDRLDVRVREGVATLNRDDHDYSAPAGTRIHVSSSGTVETGSVGNQGTEWTWVLAVAPPFDLEGRTLSEYIEWLSRETGWNVGYTDPSIAANAAAIILHGSTSGLRPDETPGAVFPTCGLRHRLDGKTLMIERAEAGARTE